MNNQTISITFGDAGENHVGMEMVGKIASQNTGFTCDELNALCQAYNGEFISLKRNAGIAIFRNFISHDDHNTIIEEMTSFEWDNKYWDARRKRVLNKHARTNVCFLNGIANEPNYEEKRGRIVDINTLPTFNRIKNTMESQFSSIIGNEKINNLICEGNNYYNNKKCGIGFHGDAERRRVIALRIGEPMDMVWQWFQNSTPIGGCEEGERFEFKLNGGDLYIMSEIAVGTNWKRKLIPTLRHAAGCDKYTKSKIASTTKSKKIKIIIEEYDEECDECDE